MYKFKLLFVSLITLLSGCDNYHFINEDYKNSSVNGTFITPLPSNTVAGDIYPVAFAVSLERRLTDKPEDMIKATNVTIESSSIDCIPSGQNNNHFCAVSLRAKPTRNGASAVSLQVDGVTFTSESTVNESAIIGYTKTNALKSFTFHDKKFEEGKSYPIEFVFVNIGREQANDISIKSLSGTLLTNVKSNCGSSLASGSACHMHGEYIPKHTESSGPKYQLTYNEGAPVDVGVRNIVEDTQLLGEVVTGLPLNIGVDTSYDVEFMFKNKSVEPVTNLTTQLLASDISGVRSDTCKGMTLASGEVCSITASIMAEQIGTLTALVAVTGDEGVSSYATVTSNVVESPIVAYVEQDLPQNMALDAPYHYLVTFSNISKSHDATGVRFAHLYPESYDVLSDTCTDSTLRSEESCHISVTTSTQTPGVQRYSSYLSFDQGTAVIASSTLSKASERSLESVVDVSFPTNMVLNHNYPFHVTFTNTGKVNSGELELLSATMDGVTIDYNTCKGTLTPGESCQVSGEYNAGKLGPVRLEASLNYGLQQDETFILAGEVVSVPIEGEIKLGLPQNIGLNNTNPISYTYRNLSSTKDATMVDVILSSTAPVHVITNTCESTNVLHAGEECEISGEFTANVPGQHQFISSLRYKEGNEVQVQSSAMVSEVVVSSQVEGSLPIVGLGQNYAILYRFSNESLADASGINISHSANLNITSDSCGATLGSGNQCEIVAEYMPTQNGQFTHTLNFDYIEGSEVSITQAVKVVDAVVLDEVVYQDGALSHGFDAGDYFNYASDYGFTILTKLQTLNISGNPERVVYLKWGGTDLNVELVANDPLAFRAHRKNGCSTTSMNTSVGCASKVLPSFRLTLTSDAYDALPTGEQSGVIYINLTQSNNTHVAMFAMPIRVIKL